MLDVGGGDGGGVGVVFWVLINTYTDLIQYFFRCN